MEAREQMNIVIIGHVDHGKSTVIGRLLADTGSLPEGKLERVKAFCEKNARPFEYAYLIDALKDEQAQGITIDTSRCFFKTPRRDYIIIDAPGHIEFLKNMVTGASRGEGALLVIDAKEGIQENSKRHGHIASMLGITQVVVLVNKMDLVGYSRELYEGICQEFREFLGKVNIKPVNFIPISAFQGDNIATPSANTPWYKGPTVLEQLDSLTNKKEEKDLPLRFPVQDIYRFTEKGDDRRIVAGTILTGVVSQGDEVIFYPSGKKSRIRTIEGFNQKPRTKVTAGEAVGFTLDTQIYIRPGEVMVKPQEKPPQVSTRFRANLFWVGKAPLVKDKTYKLKIGTTRMPVKLVEILKIIDAAELNFDKSKEQVEHNDVAECVLETAKPIPFDPIEEIELNGRFVIVDEYEISGGGIVLESLPDQEDLAFSQNLAFRQDLAFRPDLVFPQDLAIPQELVLLSGKREFLWEKGYLSPTQRTEAYGHQPKFIVLTTGSVGMEKFIHEIGKTLEQKLFEINYKVYYLGISSLVNEAGVHGSHREEHIRQIGELANIFTDAGQIFITSVFHLEDEEVESLKIRSKDEDVLVINIGENPFRNFQPAGNVPEELRFEGVWALLRRLNLFN